MFESNLFRPLARIFFVLLSLYSGQSWSLCENLMFRALQELDLDIPSTFSYDRADWGEVYVPGAITTRRKILEDRSRAPIVLREGKSSVKFGFWHDYYFPETHLKAWEVEVDHIVPLKNAHDNGAAFWSAEKKLQFATDPENLVVTKKEYNRLKGPKGIDEWLPVDKRYACRYVKNWMKIKKKYSLIITKQEMEAVAQLA